MSTPRKPSKMKLKVSHLVKITQVIQNNVIHQIHFVVLRTEIMDEHLP